MKYIRLSLEKYDIIETDENISFEKFDWTSVIFVFVYKLIHIYLGVQG